MRHDDVFHDIAGVIVLVNDCFGQVARKQLLCREFHASRPRQLREKIRTVPVVQSWLRLFAVVPAHDLDRWLAHVQIGPVRHKSGRKAHVGAIHYEGHEQGDALLAIELVDRFRALGGLAGYLRLLIAMAIYWQFRWQISPPS